MSVSYIEEQTKITKEFSFDPELYIYLQKKAKDDNVSVEDALNQIIREYALDQVYVDKQIVYPVSTVTYTTNNYSSTNNQTDLFKYFEKDE